MLRDGVIVNHMPGTDSALVASATAGTALPVGFDEGFLDCDVPMTEPAALPAGEYEVVVVVLAGSSGPAGVLAATDRIPVELTLTAPVEAVAGSWPRTRRRWDDAVHGPAPHRRPPGRRAAQP